MIHLRKLRAQFIQYKMDGDTELSVPVDTLAEAHGVMFLCPLCYKNRKQSSVGVHSVKCWFEGKVPDDVRPAPGRWTPSGNGIDDLTFVPGHRVKLVSVLLLGEGCGWHGHVVNGRAG